MTESICDGCENLVEIEFHSDKTGATIKTSSCEFRDKLTKDWSNYIGSNMLDEYGVCKCNKFNSTASVCGSGPINPILSQAMSLKITDDDLFKVDTNFAVQKYFVKKLSELLSSSYNRWKNANSVETYSNSEAYKEIRKACVDCGIAIPNGR